jgi:hypothetical protein
MRFGNYFVKKHIDASGDGGIDYYFEKNGRYYIVQSKFKHDSSRQLNFREIHPDVSEFTKTLSDLTNFKLDDPNARNFIHKLTENLKNPSARLEYYFLTNAGVKVAELEKIREYVQKYFYNQGWTISKNIYEFDSIQIQRLILNYNYGFTPYTGDRKINFVSVNKPSEQGKAYMEYDVSGFRSILGTVRINEVLDWLEDQEDRDLFIQKNVRGYQGEGNEVNKKIIKSYETEPDYFWLKHNGIIIFADSYTVDEEKRNRIILENPQIVNGAQTLMSLFHAKKRGVKRENANVVIRVIELPFENKSAYQKGINIIEGLNSQTEINPWDLRSNDERQVRIQKIMAENFPDYKYIRKTSKQEKKSKYAIAMKELANLIYCCSKGKVYDSIRADYADLFKNKYDDLFKENILLGSRNSAKKEIAQFILMWKISEEIKTIGWELEDYRQYNLIMEYWSGIQYHTIYSVYVMCNKFLSEGQLSELEYEDKLLFLIGNVDTDPVLIKRLIKKIYQCIPKSEEKKDRYLKTLPAFERIVKGTKKLINKGTIELRRQYRQSRN